MIAFLKGKIIDIEEKTIVVDVNNIGYRIYSHSQALENLKKSDEISLHIHSHIKEDAFDLYGFQDKKSLIFFKQLININGIGPKVALEIINFDIEKTKIAIIEENSNQLSKIPGIGKKTAERIILELKNKIEITDISRVAKGLDTNISEDIIQALENLGFNKKLIEKSLENLPQHIKTEEEIINFFLKNQVQSF